MGKLPYLSLYVGDWMKDPALRSVSLTARGLWIDLLCLMFESPRRGYLQLANGLLPTPAQVGRMTGCSAEEVTLALQELRTAGVFSDTDHGIMSRRMVRDEGLRAKDRARKRPVIPDAFQINSNSIPPIEDESDSESESAHSGSGSAPLEIESKGKAQPQRAREETPVSPATTPPAQRGTDGRSDGFRAFLAAYPPHRAQASLQWLWDQEGCEPIATEIMLGLGLWIASDEWVVDQMIPGMRKFIEDHKWNGAPPPKVKSAPSRLPDQSATPIADKWRKA